MNNLDRQLQDVFSLLSNPLGLVVLLLFLAAMLGAVFSARVRWVALVVLLLSTTFTLPTYSLSAIAAGAKVYRPLMFPFETFRAQTRAVSGAAVCVLLLPSIIAPLGWRKTLVPLGVIAYLVFQLTFSTMELLVDRSAKTFLSIPLFIVTFVAVGVGLNKMLQTKRDVNALLWAIVATFALMVMAISVQMVAGDRDAVFASSRLQGMTANPQFLSTIIPPALLIVLYLFLDKRQPKFLKVGLVLLAAALVLFLYWTGSRTGILMAGIGILCFFRLRLGRLLLIAGIVGVCVLGVLQFLGDEGSDQTDRFLNMQDTRSYVWKRQWSHFLESPLLGSTAEGTGFMEGGGENSYLTVAGAYGIVGLIPFAIMLVLMARDLYGTWKVRQLVPDEKELIDLLIAIFAMATVGAWFEAFLLGQFNLIVFILFGCSAIGAWLRDLATIEIEHGYPVASYGEQDADMMAFIDGE